MPGTSCRSRSPATPTTSAPPGTPARLTMSATPVPLATPAAPASCSLLTVATTIVILAHAGWWQAHFRRGMPPSPHRSVHVMITRIRYAHDVTDLDQGTRAWVVAGRRGE